MEKPKINTLKALKKPLTKLLPFNKNWPKTLEKKSKMEKILSRASSVMKTPSFPILKGPFSRGITSTSWVCEDKPKPDWPET